MGRNMLDQEFETFGGDEDDLLPDVQEKGSPPEQQAEQTGDLEVEIVDDTPDADKGKWTADKKPTDDVEDDGAIEYSKSVQKRIAKETAKTHAERRAKEERERQLSEIVGLAQKLMQENEQLKGLVENGEKVLINENRSRLESQIAQAEAAIREAHEAGDINGQIAAQKNLAKLVAEQDRLSTHIPRPLPRMSEEEIGRVVAPQQQQRQSSPDRSALEWQEKNRWFGRDEVMTAFAMGLHNHLTQREGISPSDGEEYYGRIDRELRKRFPEKFQSSAPRRTDTVVAPAVRNGGGGTVRKVTLTESQVRLARRLGLTPQQYAEQFAAENGQKEWTHGKS